MPFDSPQNHNYRQQGFHPEDLFWGIFGRNPFGQNHIHDSQRYLQDPQRHVHETQRHTHESQRHTHDSQQHTHDLLRHDPVLRRHESDSQLDGRETKLRENDVRRHEQKPSTHWLPRLHLDNPDREADATHHPVSGNSRDTLYTRQFSATTCMPTALAMAEAQFKTGTRPSPQHVGQLAEMTGTVNQGYRRGLDGVKHDSERLGMHAEVHSHSMDELDGQLNQGRGAIIRVRNPHTGNPHYVYCFGKDGSGNYIIGDPDRHNNEDRGHDHPISRQKLWDMMQHRDGFVSVWS
jgi:hypothetical protein